MPITIKVAPHGASNVYFTHTTHDVRSPREHLELACKKESKQCREILQSSTLDDKGVVHPAPNGFVRTAVRAYSDHHHLVIRPEDIWFAIISQLSLYINRHADELREKFVAHAGKKELVVEVIGSNRWNVDYGVFAKRMKVLVEECVVDPELADWFLPDFSTTTDEDRIIGSVLLMGAMQSDFDYTCAIRCGIPSVTLLGEVADWELLLTRIDKLHIFGEEPSQWFTLLQPVLKRFVQTFKDPESNQVVSFWNRIAHVNDMGSGPTYYSGWITAFCFWDVDGKSKYDVGQRGPCHTYTSLGVWKRTEWPNLVLDGATYHRVDASKVPPGYSSVPVLIDEYGKHVPAMMVAGSVGIGCTSSGQQIEQGGMRSSRGGRGGTRGGRGGMSGMNSDGTGLDTVQPVAGWWMFERKESQEGLGDSDEEDGRGRGRNGRLPQWER